MLGLYHVQEQSRSTTIPAPNSILLLLITLFLFTAAPCHSNAEDPPAPPDHSSPPSKEDPLIQLPTHPPLEQLRQAFSLNPYNMTMKRNLETGLFFYGIESLKQKHYDAAATLFASAEDLFPDDPQPPLLRGNTAYLQKQYDLALSELNQSRKAGGDTFDVLYLLGLVFYDTDDIGKAVEVWDLAIQKDPDNKTLQVMLAKAKRELSVDSGMSKGQTSRFILSYDAEIKSDAAGQVLETLENAFNNVGHDLDTYPESRIPIILYAGKNFHEITGSPDWAGGQYDGKIRLPVGGMTEVTPQVSGVLYHEYTHVVVNELTRGNCPVWLNEGLAEMEGRKQYDTPLTVLSAKKKSLIPMESVSKSFVSLESNSVQLAYQQSYSLVNFIVTNYGWHVIKDILVSLGEGDTFETASHHALYKIGVTFTDLLSQWNKYLTSPQ